MCGTWPFFTPFQNTSLQLCFLSSGTIQHRSTHICNGESGLFYPPKWDPFWCDIWENYQSIREQERGLLTLFSIGWSPPQSTCPLVTDITFDPDLLLDVVKHSPSLHTSLILVLSCSQSARCVCHSPSIVLRCLLLLIHHRNGVTCHFKARSDSLCGLHRLSL